MKGYFLRVVARVVAVFLVAPLVWLYYPKALLVLIRWDTAAVDWCLRQGVKWIPNPEVRYWVDLTLQASDTAMRVVAWGIDRIPEESRYHVEVLIRMRLEPGGWLLLGQITTGLVILWLVLHLKYHNKKKVAPEAPPPPPPGLERVEPKVEKSKASPRLPHVLEGPQIGLPPQK